MAAVVDCLFARSLVCTHIHSYLHSNSLTANALDALLLASDILALALTRRESNIFLSLSAGTSTPVSSKARHLRQARTDSLFFSGKSTTTGRLIFELGGIPERELEKLKAEADALGKSSFAFAFYMDTQKEERARGVTISCTTKEFFTEKWHYTIIDAPGECGILISTFFLL